MFDCSLVAIRHKEDPWNSIMSGAATGGFLALRAGPKTAGKNAIIGGVLLALIEGLGIAVNQLAAKLSRPSGDTSPGGPGKQEGGEKVARLAPPLPPVGMAVGYRPTGGDIDSSATRSGDVVTGSGFDTGSRFEDSSATQDPFADRSGDPYFSGGGGEAGVGSGGGGAEKRGWFGRLLGRGGK